MRRILTLAAVVAGLTAPASAATVLGYDTENGVSIAATETGLGVTGDDLTRGAGLTQNSGGTFNSRGWTETSLADAQADDDALRWGFSSTVAYDLTALEIGYDRSNTGAMEINIFYSLAGGKEVSLFTDNSISASGEENTIDLSFLDNVTDIEFILYGWGATSGAGTFDIEKQTVGPNAEFGIFVSGEAVAVVPLPAALPMLAGALGLFGLIRRRG